MNNKQKDKIGGANIMTSMEFLYEFLEPEEFIKIRQDLEKAGYSLNTLLYPDKVEMWLIAE